MGEMEIISMPGKGTKVTVRKWLRKQYEQFGTKENITNITLQ